MHHHNISTSQDYFPSVAKQAQQFGHAVQI